jgi:hypothetical protein
MSFSVSWKFDLQFGQDRRYDALMPRSEFTESMKAILAEQKRKADQNQQEKLHDAEILKTQTPSNWSTLIREAQAIVQAIGDNQLTLSKGEGNNTFVLMNGTSRLEITLQGYSIRYAGYSGVSSGYFAPLIMNSQVIYASSGNASAPMNTQTLNSAMTAEQVAEALVSMVVGKP